MENTTEKLQLQIVSETGLKKAYLAERDAARRALAELSSRVHSGYDFNADPDSITALVGAALHGERFPDAWADAQQDDDDWVLEALRAASNVFADMDATPWDQGCPVEYRNAQEAVRYALKSLNQK